MERQLVRKSDTPKVGELSGEIMSDIRGALTVGGFEGLEYLKKRSKGLIYLLALFCFDALTTSNFRSIFILFLNYFEFA